MGCLPVLDFPWSTHDVQLADDSLLIHQVVVIVAVVVIVFPRIPLVPPSCPAFILVTATQVILESILPFPRFVCIFILVPRESATWLVLSDVSPAFLVSFIFSVGVVVHLIPGRLFVGKTSLFTELALE